MFRTRLTGIIGAVVVVAFAHAAFAAFILPMPEGTTFNINLRDYHMATTYTQADPPAVLQPAPGQANPQEDAWGIFKVTSITDDADFTVLWQDGDDGWELTGVFYGVHDTSVTWNAATQKWTIQSEDMRFALYANPVGSFAPTKGIAGRLGIAGYDGITNVVGGEHLFTAETTPPDNGLPEYEAILHKSGNGSLLAWADVVPGMGTQWEAFASGQQGGTDLSLSARIFPNTGGTGGWQFQSSDPVRGYIPEPATLALLSLGLLPVLRRRRRN